MPSNPAQDLGDYGEQLVCQWLKGQHCQVLHRRWHCRFGEIDLIAQGESGSGALRSPMLAFIEVKTRSQGSWDAHGLLAVTLAKQQKIRTTARYFLVRHPHLSELPCRFDIALVSCHTQPPHKRPYLQIPSQCSGEASLPPRFLCLQQYLRDAF